MNYLTNSYSFSVEKPPKKSSRNSTTQLPEINNFFLSNIITTSHRPQHRSRQKKSKTIRYTYPKIDRSFDATFGKLRKDIYGNTIEKGGNHKISFKDDIKGKKLVETHLIDLKKNVIKNKKTHNKISKKDFIIEENLNEREAKDKEKIICSGACFIF